MWTRYDEQSITSVVYTSVRRTDGLASLCWIHQIISEDFHELHEYSVSDYAFWVDLWEFLGIISSVPPNPARVCSIIHFLRVVHSEVKWCNRSSRRGGNYISLNGFRKRALTTQKIFWHVRTMELQSLMDGKVHAEEMMLCISHGGNWEDVLAR